MIIARLLLGLFIAWLLGFLIVSLFDRGKGLPVLEKAALSYLVGQASITLILFILFLLPIAQRPLIAVLLVLLFFAGRVFFVREKRQCNLPPRRIFFGQVFGDSKKLVPVILLLVLVVSLAVKISYSFVETCSKPEYSWDAGANWTTLGRNIYFTEKHRPDKLWQVMTSYASPSYPSNYPRAVYLMHYWLFWSMGEANDQWSKIIFPIGLLCLLIIFYYGLKAVRGQLGALAFTCFLSSAPLFLYHSTIGYADLTRTIYFAIGIIYFYRWLQTKQTKYFWFFAIPMAFTTWIKLEGKALYGIGLLLLLFYLWRDNKELLKDKIFYVGSYLFLFMIIGLPWQLVTLLSGLGDPQGAFQPILSMFFEFHAKIYALMFMQGSWGLFWIMAAATLLFFFKRQMTGENLYLFLTILLFYGSLLFIYLGYHGTAVWSLTDTFPRVLFSIYPVVVFNMGCVIPLLKIDQEVEV